MTCAHFDLQAGADFADTMPSDVAPLDVSRFPPSAAFGDECACEGAAPTVSYDAGQVIRESERENLPLLIFGSVVVVALVLAACVVWPWGFAHG